VKSLNAGEVFNEIARAAWSVGDPGILFMDEINRHNPTPELGEIEATNPCGEQPLLPYESCNLGSINLSKMVDEGEINWERLEQCVRVGVRFLDDVISVNVFPLPEIKEITLKNRKIGLGVMGLADMFIKMGISYGSPYSYEVAEGLMAFIQRIARDESSNLGEEKGDFPNFPKSIWADRYEHMRNATVTTIAPTGSISIIASCSSGIEPIFSVAYVREALEGELLFHYDENFVKIAKERGFYSENLMKKVLRQPSISSIEEIPEDIRELFKCAMDLTPEQHVRMQAVFQRHVDNAVSKTVNMREDCTVEDIKEAYLLAWRLKCKGITVFRYRSREKQVISIFGDVVNVSEEVMIAKTCPGSHICPV
jgi:ribonucleoside-diphosphate reductase alpha chain